MLVTALVSLLVGLERIVTFSLTIVAVLFFMAYLIYWFFRQRERFANAWFKNFDPRYPSSGFIRIWDFEPYKITDSMLEELYEVALSKFIKDSHTK